MSTRGCAPTPSPWRPTGEKPQVLPVLCCTPALLCCKLLCSAMGSWPAVLCYGITNHEFHWLLCPNCAVLGTLCPTLFATEGQLAWSHQCAQYIVTSLTEVIKLLRPCQLLLYVLSSLSHSLQAQMHGASAQHSAPALACRTPCIRTVCEQSQLL